MTCACRLGRDPIRQDQKEHSNTRRARGSSPLLPLRWFLRGSADGHEYGLGSFTRQGWRAASPVNTSESVQATQSAQCQPQRDIANLLYHQPQAPCLQSAASEDADHNAVVRLATIDDPCPNTRLISSEASRSIQSGCRHVSPRSHRLLQRAEPEGLLTGGAQDQSQAATEGGGVPDEPVYVICMHEATLAAAS
jgi:hypothetical protein